MPDTAKAAAKAVLVLAFFVLFCVVTFGVGARESGPIFGCASATVTDGDTFRCGKLRIRLYGIDAPELPGHCRKGRRCTPGDPYASTRNLSALLDRGDVQCRTIDHDVYGRVVADCTAARVDLSCAQLSGGFAVRRYGNIGC
jgi:endonuclease YncB( thermonuclease family)